jgi:hypothetical protein
MHAPYEAISQDNYLAVSVGPAVAVRRGRILCNKRLPPGLLQPAAQTPGRNFGD